MRTSPPSETDVESDHDEAARRPDPRTQSRWIPVAVLALAVIAAIAATWTLASPGQPASQPAGPVVDAQQSDAAKARVCGAFAVVRQAVSVQTNADLGNDPVAREAVAANARLAILGGGAYLLSRLDPATPEELATSVRAFANDVQDIGMNQLIGIPNADPKVVALLSAAKESSTHITKLCA